jgi:hypothetical protein
MVWMAVPDGLTAPSPSAPMINTAGGSDTGSARRDL